MRFSFAVHLPELWSIPATGLLQASSSSEEYVAEPPEGDDTSFILRVVLVERAGICLLAVATGFAEPCNAIQSFLLLPHRIARCALLLNLQAQIIMMQV